MPTVTTDERPFPVPGEPGQRRLRVALIITGLELGGGGAVINTIANAIDQSRFELDVYCILAGGPMEAPIRRTGCQVEVLKGTYDYDRRLFAYHPLKMFKLAQTLRRKRYDVVHTHLFHADVVGRIAALMARTPIIIKSLHNMGRWKPRRYVAADRVLNRWTDTIVCCSDYQREVAGAQERFGDTQAITITHGVQLSRFDTAIHRAEYRAQLGLQPNSRVVGTIGRPIPEKGHQFLIRAVPDILRRHPETEFLIVGEGSQRESLQALAAGPEFRNRVHFSGARGDVPEVLSVMDVFAFPSLSEGFGIAVIEAMAARLPVVASNIRPLSDMIQNEVNGLLVPPSDPAALAEAVSRVLSDDRLRHALSARGRELVEARYADVPMVRAHEDLYVSLLRSAVARGEADRVETAGAAQNPAGKTRSSATARKEASTQS